jgi:hypothetical protein
VLSHECSFCPLGQLVKLTARAKHGRLVPGQLLLLPSSTNATSGANGAD